MALKIEVLNSESGFKAIEAEWQDLIQQVRPGSIFLTYEWQYHWWQNYQSHLNQPQLVIVTVRNEQDGRLLAILPLFRQNKIFPFKQTFKTMQLMGTEVESSDYLDIICAAEKKVFFLRKIFSAPEFLHWLDAADVLILENIHGTSSLLLEKEELDNLLNTVSYQYRIKICPYLPLPDSIDRVLSSLSKNFRSNLKRARNKFKRQGFQINTVQDEAQIESAIENLFKLHDQRFKAKQAASKFNFDRRGHFHKQIARAFLKNGWLQLYQIFDQQQVIGSLYCFKFQDSMMYVQGGFDPAYAQYGLGNQIILKAIEDAIALKLKKFDFMRGAEAYKFKWTDKKIFLHQIITPLSLKAKLYFALQDVIFKTKQLVKQVIKTKS